MRIWSVAGQNVNGVYEHHFAATKSAAEAKAAEIVEGTENEADVDPIEVRPTRAGIVRALNDFIAYTCLNEG